MPKDEAQGDFMKEPLTAVKSETTMAEYEEELRRSREKNQRKPTLLDSAAQTSPSSGSGPGLNQEIPMTLQIKDEPEEQMIKQEEEHLEVSVSEYNAVCVKTEESSLLQQTGHKESEEEEDVSSDTYLPSESESDTDHSSYTDNDEDWRAPLSCANVGDHDQVQTRTRRTTAKSSSKSKSAPKTSAAVNTSDMSGTAEGKVQECPVCKKTLKGPKQNLLQHMRIHTDERPYSCSICHRAFHLKNHLKTHMRTHTGEKPFSCSICDKTFSTSSQLKSHQITHTGERPFSCSICQKQFPRSNGLKNHMRVHTGEKPFSCSICNKTFAFQSNHQRHLRYHTGEKPRVKKSTGTAAENNGDVSGTPEVAKGKTFQCPVCKKTLKGHAKTLEQHLRVHTGERPYSCSICQKAFPLKNHLDTHMRTHTGERPFSCPICNKTFAQRSHLNIHKITHTGEKTYSCSICQKLFAQSYGLKTHMRTHTGEKPFSCSFCSKTFNTKSNQQRHLKQHA